MKTKRRWTRTCHAQQWPSPANFRKAAPSRCEVRLLQMGNGVNNSYRYEFLLVFLDSFLFCSNIATKYACQFSKGCSQPFRSYITKDRQWMENFYRYKFLLVFLNSFFILIYYTYGISLQNLKGLHPTISKLQCFLSL